MGVYIDKNDFKQLEQNNLLFSTIKHYLIICMIFYIKLK